jgi:hypothetical protein
MTNHIQTHPIKRFLKGIGIYFLALVLFLLIEYILFALLGINESYSTFINITEFNSNVLIILSLFALPLIAVFIRPLKKGIPIYFLALILTSWIFSDGEKGNQSSSKSSYQEDARIDGIYTCEMSGLSYTIVITGNVWQSESVTAFGEVARRGYGTMDENKVMGEYGIEEGYVKNGAVHFHGGPTAYRK